MTGVTSGQVGLPTATDSDDTEHYLTVDLTAGLQTVDDKFHNSTGHNHDASGEGAPILAAGLAGSIPASKLAAGAVMVKLAELGGAAASYDFQSIPQTYRHLELVVYARSDTVALSTGLRMRLQNVSTASYYDQALIGTGATASASEVIAGTSARVGNIAGASAPAPLTGTARILIPHYTQSNKEKGYIASCTLLSGVTTGTLQVVQFGGMLDSSSAIDRVTVFPLAGSFVVDSIATLYGLPL